MAVDAPDTVFAARTDVRLFDYGELAVSGAFVPPGAWQKEWRVWNDRENSALWLHWMPHRTLIIFR